MPPNLVNINQTHMLAVGDGGGGSGMVVAWKWQLGGDDDVVVVVATLEGGGGGNVVMMVDLVVFAMVGLWRRGWRVRESGVGDRLDRKAGNIFGFAKNARRKSFPATAG
nr:hypothetical protein [Tanacetum cinerariifolium]